MVARGHKFTTKSQSRRFMENTNTLGEILRGIKLTDVMDTKVIALSEEDTLTAAQTAFVANKVNHLVVVDHARRIQGILSQKYLYRAHSPRKIISPDQTYNSDMLIDGDCYFSKQSLDSYKLKYVMHKTPFVLKIGDNLATAILYMAKKRLAFIPIVDDIQHVVGTITDQDIIIFISRIIAK
jgi:CBS-domain-containing membrane protein